jgi:phosphatidylglycerophosphate synthase
MRKTEPDVLTVRTGPMAGLIAQLALLAVLAAAAGLTGAGWSVGLVCGVATAALLAGALNQAGVARLTPADRVTLTRAVLVGGLAALLADGFAGPLARPVVVTLAVLALLLDAVDGWVARHTDTTSPLGARFDMEVDAFLILALSVQVARSLGPWVLAIGAARYLLGIAAWRLAWLREPTPTRYWGKVVAAVQGIVLTTAVADVLPRQVMLGALLVALALLAESFGRQVWWLRSHRPTPAPEIEELAGMAGCR